MWCDLEIAKQVFLLTVHLNIYNVASLFLHLVLNRIYEPDSKELAYVAILRYFTFLLRDVNKQIRKKIYWFF